VADIIDEAIETSRSLTAELSPPILHQSGLIAALEWLVLWMHEKHGLNVDLIAEKRPRIPSGEMEICLFQAVRELLFNVVKHAGVKSARIRLTDDNNRIQISVEDEGAGFDPSQLRSAGGRVGGFGLFTFSERINVFGGRLSIDSSPGVGSRILLDVPLVGQNKASGNGIAGKEAAASSSGRSKTALQGTMQPRRLRIALVDDHIAMRQGLAGLLQAEPDMEVVGQASDGESGVKLIREIRPDVVLMDISMPRMNGIQATRIIHSELPEVRIIGLSMFKEGEQAQAMREAGAVDYLTKSGPSEAVVAAIRSCVRGDSGKTSVR
jgi:CheY-like chemotaxis protein